MARKQKYSAEQVIEAIKQSNGIITTAAKALGCARGTINNYVNKYVTVADALEETRETTLDFVENQLMKQIQNNNLTAIIFFLKTQGKNRGYNERTEFTGDLSGTIEVVWGSDNEDDKG